MVRSDAIGESNVGATDALRAPLRVLSLPLGLASFLGIAPGFTVDEPFGLGDGAVAGR